MKIKKLLPINFGANCYLVIYNNEAIIIDPSVSVKVLQDELGDKILKGILLTHGHFDHILTLEEALIHFKVPLFLHLNAIKKLENSKENYSLFTGKKIALNLDKYDYKTVTNNDTLDIISEKPIIVYETPGHTNCSVCYLIDHYLFTGDTLFRGTVGRTDLYTGSKDELKKSINFLKTLPEHTIIYPGHEEDSTLLNEKMYNLYFK